MKRFALLASVLFVGCSVQQSTPTGDVARLPANETPTSDVNAKMVAFNSTGAPTVCFHVPEMMCPDGCAPKVREALAAQPGVKDVLVEFATKTATVAFEEGQFDASAAIALLDDEYGFPNTTVVPEESSSSPVDHSPPPAEPTDAQG